MKQFLFIILFLTAFSSIKAQQFNRAIGVRLGPYNSLFFDQQNDELSNYRFMLSWRENGKQFTAMKYYMRYDFGGLPEFLSFYYGFGAHAGYVKWDQRIVDDSGYYWDKRSAPIAGLDGLVGISYDFDKIPISVICDVKPSFDLWGPKLFKMNPFDAALGVVYTF